MFIILLHDLIAPKKRLRFIKTKLSKVLDKEKLSNKIKEFAKATKSSKEWKLNPNALEKASELRSS